ncbi:MAG TPA: ABC transporter permease, partial [Candidatus Eremiobacteraeota bacterium]|nr:ABC transporter permease [Candidatus Eremiobacteraeota bacterium]
MKDFLLRYKSWGKEGKAGFLISPAFLWLLLFFLIPLGIIFVYSFCERGNYGGVNWNFTFENYKQVLNPVYLKTILYSFWIAILNTVICLLIGYPMAYYISTRKSTAFKNILLILVILPFWTDFLVRTYAWLVILREGGLINTILLQMGIIQEPLKLLFTDLAVIIGLVYGYLPFMILPLYASIEKLDPSLIEAAYDLGANGFNVFWKVILPLTSPGIIAGSILVFVPTLGAYITPDLLGGAKVMMIGNLIQQQFLKVKNWPFGSS